MLINMCDKLIVYLTNDKYIFNISDD